MKRILDKKKWMKVADAMKIPKQVYDIKVPYEPPLEKTNLHMRKQRRRSASR